MELENLVDAALFIIAEYLYVVFLKYIFQLTPLGGEHAKGGKFSKNRSPSFEPLLSIPFVRPPSFDPLRSIPFVRSPRGEHAKGKVLEKIERSEGRHLESKHHSFLNSLAPSPFVRSPSFEPFRSIPFVRSPSFDPLLSIPFARSLSFDPLRSIPFVRAPPSPFVRSPRGEHAKGKVLEKIERSEGRQLESNHHSLLNMSARQAIEMFALNGFEAYVFTVCPVMVKPEVILSFVQKGNPSKSATFHRKIVDLIQDYSAAFLRTPRTVTQTPNESEMAAILETLRRFAKDEFRFDLFKKNLQLVFELMAENPEKEKHLIDNASLCKLLNETQNYLHHSNLDSHWEATYSPDKSKVKFTEHPNETVQRKKAKKA